MPGSVDTKIADSTRNRPDEPPSEAQAADHYFVADTLRTMTSTQGRHPDEAADIVFDALRAGQFWITTSDSFDEILKPRFDSILARELPGSAQFD